MNILLGISGGIAAYKICELTRLLIKANHNVKIMMTEEATQLIHPNTFAALSNHRVYLKDGQYDDSVMAHIDLAKWADKILIAPATANTLSKLAHGLADNLLTSTCLAVNPQKTEVLISSAMNVHMWNHPATQNNLNLIQKFNYTLIQPSSGSQACGDNGMGRLPEPEYLLNYLTQNSNFSKLFQKKILITAGPTLEKIDPVRYLSNFSSGKMGYALAKAFRDRGAEVILISGPCQLEKPDNLKFVSVQSTEEMLNKVLEYAPESDLFISAAAVCDYSPINYSDQKLKKIKSNLDSNLNSNQNLILNLKPNPDIVQTISNQYPNLFTVGFCAETEHLEHYARNKLTQKNLNAIIANKILKSGYPFNSDFNTAIYITKHKNKLFEKLNKFDLAELLVCQIIEDFGLKADNHK